MIKIEKNVPMPGNRYERTGLRAALAALEIGDSFVMHVSSRSAIPSMGKTAAPGAKFTTRKINDTECRVWRVA